jgi:hypothetical protein
MDRWDGTEKSNVIKKSNDTNKGDGTGKKADNHNTICITDSHLGKILCCITHQFRTFLQACFQIELGL